MADSLAKERNSASKGKTGMSTRKRRKQRGAKARSWEKGTTPPGNHSSPTDHVQAPQKKKRKK